MQEKRRFDKVLIDSFDFEKNAKKRRLAGAHLCFKTRRGQSTCFVYLTSNMCRIYAFSIKDAYFLYLANSIVLNI